MNSKLKKLRLGAREIANLCGCTTQTIAGHCRSGELKCLPYRASRKAYCVSGTEFVNYLRSHPSALIFFKTANLSDEDAELREAVLEAIGTLPRYYTTYDFMDIFGVTDRTITNWVKRGYMKSYSYEHPHNHYRIYFTEDSLQELIVNCRKARKFYNEYIEKRRLTK